MRLLRDLRKGGRFETTMTHKKGKILSKGEGSIRVKWDSRSIVSFLDRDGDRKSWEKSRTESIAPTTEVL